MYLIYLNALSSTVNIINNSTFKLGGGPDLAKFQSKRENRRFGYMTGWGQIWMVQNLKSIITCTPTPPQY